MTNLKRFFGAAAGAALLVGVSAHAANAQTQTSQVPNNGEFSVPVASPAQMQAATQRLGRFLDKYFDFTSGTSSTLEAILQAADETGNTREGTLLQAALNRIHPIAINKLPPAQQASMAQRVLDAVVLNTRRTRAALGNTHPDLHAVFATMDREAAAWNEIVHPRADLTNYSQSAQRATAARTLSASTQQGNLPPEARPTRAGAPTAQQAPRTTTRDAYTGSAAPRPQAQAPLPLTQVDQQYPGVMNADRAYTLQAVGNAVARLMPYREQTSLQQSLDTLDMIRDTLSQRYSQGVPAQALVRDGDLRATLSLGATAARVIMNSPLYAQAKEQAARNDASIRGRDFDADLTIIARSSELLNAPGQRSAPGQPTRP